jgi:hypothetical protein
MKSLGIIIVGFAVTDQLLSRFSAFVRYEKEKRHTMRQKPSHKAKHPRK